MPGSDATTSLQRTYRYLRLAIAGAVVVVFTAVLVAMPAVGLLPSLSHYYDTSANTVFVGALIAVSVCFFALSGRGAERVLLDAAATVVPLVAIVPTMISSGSVPGIDAHCPPGRGSCVPAAFDAAVHGGVLTDLIVGAVFVLIAVGRAVVVIGMPLYGSLHVGHLFGVFVGEVLALVLFAAFWVLQSVQYWRVDDPAIRAQV